MKRIMSKEEFLSVYERQQASGLTIKDFCENESYSSSCFHYWKKKFGLSRTYTSHPDKLPMIHSFHWICVAEAISRQVRVAT